jgi:hypothetical protein
MGTGSYTGLLVIAPAPIDVTAVVVPSSANDEIPEAEIHTKAAMGIQTDRRIMASLVKKFF